MGIAVYGRGGTTLRTALQSALGRRRPRVVAIASAYVSLSGIVSTRKVLRRAGVAECRLIAGTSGLVTHPSALTLARALEWQLRVDVVDRPIYHPKLWVAGAGFDSGGYVHDPCFVYVGSGNLTGPGLEENLEVAWVEESGAALDQAADVFSSLWNDASQPDKRFIARYTARFAEASRRRAIEDLEALGTADLPVFPGHYARAAWAGLESHTGEYQFQVEFPKRTAAALRRLIRGAVANRRIRVVCADGATRDIVCDYYERNAMYRVNIPRDVPNAEWAYQNRAGIAMLWHDRPNVLHLDIFRPGPVVDDAIARSRALGTLTETTTRLSGWY